MDRLMRKVIGGSRALVQGFARTAVASVFELAKTISEVGLYPVATEWAFGNSRA